jgi:hypothetical protein
MTAIIVTNTHTNRVPAELEVLGWDGKKLHRLFRPWAITRGYAIMPESDTSKLVIAAAGGRGGGDLDIPDFYVVRTNGVRFANADYPGEYAPYVKIARNYMAGASAPSSLWELTNTLRALIYAGEYDLCLQLSQKVIEELPRLENTDMHKVSDVYSRLAIGPIREIRGELHLARGEEAAAYPEYVAAAVPFEDSKRVGDALNQYLGTLPPDEARRYSSDKELQRKVNAEIGKRLDNGQPSPASQGRAWEMIGEEYARRCLFQKARIAFRKAIDILAPIAEENLRKDLANRGGEFTREQYLSEHPNAMYTHYLERSLKEISEHEPD